MAESKQVVFIIEGFDNLQTLLHSNLPLNTPFSKDLLRILINTPTYDQHMSIWLTYTGIIRGINTVYRATQMMNNNQNIDNQATLETLHEIAKNNDTLVIYTDLSTATWNIMSGETQFKSISSHHAKQLLTKHITHLQQLLQGNVNETKKFTTKEHTY
jgi:hypothetical protein